MIYRATIQHHIGSLTVIMLLLALPACSDPSPTAPDTDETQQSGWSLQDSLSQGFNLFGVSFPDVNTGTAVGDSGTILRTTDGGANWVSQTSGTIQRLKGVSFSDANTGTAVGDNGIILRTTDGGANWVSQISGTTQNLFGVSFSDATPGTAVG